MKVKDSRKSPSSPRKPAFFMDEIANRLDFDFSDPKRRLFAEWENLGLGEVAKHSSPSELKNGVLIVNCENGSWASILDLKKEEAMDLARARCPGLHLTGIKVRVKAY